MPQKKNRASCLAAFWTFERRAPGRYARLGEPPARCSGREVSPNIKILFEDDNRYHLPFVCHSSGWFCDRLMWAGLGLGEH